MQQEEVERGRKPLRCLLRLMDFDFIVEYIPGNDNVSADCLSRSAASKPDITDVEKVSECYYHVPSAVSVAVVFHVFLRCITTKVRSFFV